MADIGLDRTDEKRSVGFPSLAVDIGHSVDLDGISHGRSGPVGLHVRNLRRRNSRILQSRLHHLFQPGRIRDS